MFRVAGGTFARLRRWRQWAAGPGAQTGRGVRQLAVCIVRHSPGVGLGDELERAVRGGLVLVSAAFGDHRSRPAGVLADDPLLHRGGHPTGHLAWHRPGRPGGRRGPAGGFPGHPGPDGAAVPRRPGPGHRRGAGAVPARLRQARRRRATPPSGGRVRRHVQCPEERLGAVGPGRHAHPGGHLRLPPPSHRRRADGDRTRCRPHPDRHQRHRPGRHPGGDRGRVRPLGHPRPRPEPAHPRRARQPRPRPRRQVAHPGLPGDPQGGGGHVRTVRRAAGRPPERPARRGLGVPGTRARAATPPTTWPPSPGR